MATTTPNSIPLITSHKREAFRHKSHSTIVNTDIIARCMLLFIDHIANLCMCFNKDFDTMKTPLHNTAGRYKPTSTRHGTTLASLANGSTDTACKPLSRNNRDKLLYSVKNHYDIEDDVVL